jgi:AcrR family transcriptional regulator
MTSSAAENAALAGAPPAAIGLRERKKARTRATIRSEALRLFADRGFATTTVEQIAEAADVSPSTFFRYFPTKEAVVITDDFDPLIFQEFRNQPADTPPIRAFRNAIRIVFGQLTEASVEQELVRQRLLQTVPELRSAMLDEFGVSLGLLAEMIGERTGRTAEDPRVRTLAGAVIGVVLSVTLRHWHLTPPDPQLPPVRPETSPVSNDLMNQMIGEIDAALELLELGLPL